MFLNGLHEAQLVQLRLLDIHGTYYYDIAFTHTGETQLRRARIGKEDIYPNPEPGELVRVSYVMNVVTGVHK